MRTVLSSRQATRAIGTYPLEKPTRAAVLPGARALWPLLAETGCGSLLILGVVAPAERADDGL